MNNPLGGGSSKGISFHATPNVMHFSSKHPNDQWGIQRSDPKFRELSGGIIENKRTGQWLKRSHEHGNRWVGIKKSA